MKIVFISSPFVVPEPFSFHSVAPPLGLLCIASTLRDAGHDVTIIDIIAEAPDQKKIIAPGISCYGLAEEDIIMRLMPMKPDIIGISIMFHNSIDVSIGLLNAIGRKIPDALLIAGGHAATASYLHLFERVDKLDAVALGEAEESFLNWLNDGANKKNTPYNSNIVTRGSYVLGMPHEPARVEDLNTLPIPAYDLIQNHDRYTSYPICTSRGCPYNCIFCSVQNLCGKSWRPRSVENIILEIRHLYETYGIDSYYITDDNFTLRPDRVIDFCDKLISLNIDIRWNCLQGINTAKVSLEMLRKLKQAGCEALSFAVESASPEIQKAIGKKISLEKVRQIAEWCRVVGLFSNAMFVIGIPGETKDTIERSKAFAIDVGFDGISVAIATPFPGTELYRQCTENNYLVGSNHGYFNLREAVITTPWLSSSELKAMQMDFLQSYAQTYSGKIPYEKVKLYMRNPNRETWDAIRPYVLEGRS